MGGSACINRVLHIAGQTVSEDAGLNKMQTPQGHTLNMTDGKLTLTTCHTEYLQSVGEIILWTESEMKINSSSASPARSDSSVAVVDHRKLKQNEIKKSNKSLVCVSPPVKAEGVI